MVPRATPASTVVSPSASPLNAATIGMIPPASPATAPPIESTARNHRTNAPELAATR